MRFTDSLGEVVTVPDSEVSVLENMATPSMVQERTPAEK